MDDNSSSGASRVYSTGGDAGEPVDEHGAGNEDVEKPTSQKKTQQEDVENVNQPQTQTSVGHDKSSQRLSSQKLPPFPSAFGCAQS